jgi:hypothetical protein
MKIFLQESTGNKGNFAVRFHHALDENILAGRSHLSSG